MMKLKIHAEVEDEDTCSISCPFLDEDLCILFDTHLEDVALEEGHTREPKEAIPKQRNLRCMDFKEEPKEAIPKQRNLRYMDFKEK